MNRGKRIITVLLIIALTMGSVPVYAIQQEDETILSESELVEQEKAAELLLEESNQGQEQRAEEVQERMGIMREEIKKEIAQRTPPMTPFTSLDFDGEGTAESPYVINSIERFRYFAERVNEGNSFQNTYFKLTENIDLYEVVDDEVIPWRPIRGFEGNFDGDNYGISGLYIDSEEDHQGLFGFVLNAEIKNVNLEIMHMNVTGEYTGALVGFAENTIISNCFVRGNIKTIGSKVGGILGAGLESAVWDSRFHGSIESITDFENVADIVGGIVGLSENGQVEGCSTAGKIVANEDVGGIVGMMININPTDTEETLFNYYIRSNLNRADISGSRSVGGIIGSLRNIQHVRTRTYVWFNANEGNVSATRMVGGIIGMVEGNIQMLACYNVGDIAATLTIAGGIVGQLNYRNPRDGGAALNRCYNAGRISSGLTASQGGLQGGIAGYTGSAILNGYILANGVAGVGAMEEYLIINIRILSSESLKTLGGNLSFYYLEDEHNINGGYPILDSINYGMDEYVEEPEFSYASGGQSDYTAKYYYQDEYFMHDARIYNPSLATMSLNLAMSAFASNEATYENQSKNVRKLLEDTGFANIKHNASYASKPERDSIGVIIGNKKIEDNGEEYTLLAVALRGQGYEAEWAGNFRLGEIGEHEGFAIAREQVLAFLNEYVQEENNHVSENVKIWITGYSRAAAVTNLTVGRLMQRGSLGNGIAIQQEHVYGYGFETPAGTLIEYAWDENSFPRSNFQNMHNIINFNDPVPKVAPFVFDFTRYGIDYVIPTAETATNYVDTKATMLKRYAELDSVGRYAVDDFKVFNPVGILIREDPRELQSQHDFLNETIDRLAIDIFKNRTFFVEEYQSMIRDVIRTLYEDDASTKHQFSEFFMARLQIAILESVLTYLLTGSDVVTTSDLTSLLLADIQNIVKDSLRDAGIIRVSEETLSKVTGVITTLLVDFILADIGATITFWRNRNSFAAAHYPELCLAWLQAMDTNYTEVGKLADFSESRGSYRRAVVNSPVDVKVYDESNTLVAAIIDDTPQTIAGSSIISSMNADGEKLVYLPATTTYRLELIATGDGVMNFTPNEYSGRMQSTNRILGYFDVPIQTGDVLTAIMPAYSEEDLQGGSVHGSSTSYQLFDARGVEIAATLSLKGQEASDALYRVAVNTEDVEKGGVQGGGTRRIGSFAQVMAFPEEGYEFTGWYTATGDEQLSEEIEYRFRVETDTEIMAKFHLTGETGSVSTVALREKIKEIEDENLVETTYTEETWTAFTEVLQQAQEIVEATDTTQETIDDVFAALIQAFGALQEKVIFVDKSELQAKIGEVEALLESLEEVDYIEITWTNLQNILVVAKEIEAKAGASQEEVDTVLVELVQAVGYLQKKTVPTDKSELQAKIQEVEELIVELEEADYIEVTWTNLQSILATAKEIEVKAGASQEEVDTVLTELLQAVEYLQKKTVPTDKSELQAKIQEVEELIAELEETDYIEVTWTNLQSVLATAKEIEVKAEASQEEVDTILAELVQAVGYLREKPLLADRSGLQAKIQEMEELIAELEELDYIEITWTNLQNVLAAAKEIEMKAEASQEEIDTILAELVQAVGYLQKKTVPTDKSELQAKIEEVEELIAELEKTDYIEVTWINLQNVLDAAKGIVAKVEASQEEADTALAELVQAVEYLQKKTVQTNKSELQAKIQEVEELIAELEEADYTETTWANLQSALAVARAIEVKAEASQKEVDGALLELIQSVQQLVRINSDDTTNADNNSSNNGNNGNTSNDSTTNNTSNDSTTNNTSNNTNNASQNTKESGAVKTGDTRNVAIVVFLIILSSITIVIQVCKRRKTKYQNDAMSV